VIKGVNNETRQEHEYQSKHGNDDRWYVVGVRNDFFIILSEPAAGANEGCSLVGGQNTDREWLSFLK
jgi:hypothetical protein